jgi:hypothetical protein
MKIRADEHVSPKIVNALRVISPGLENALSHVIEMGQSGHPDVSWAKAFSADGGTAILTSDKGFTKGPQRKAIEGTGLQVVLLPEKWAFSTVYYQAAFILFWWSKIEKTVSTGKKSDIWILRWGFNENGELKKHIKKKNK